MVRSLILVVGICAMYIVVAADELYSDKYDHIDVLAILADDALREQYYTCFMDTGPCVTDDAAFFKGNLPEAIVTRCTKCTERQKEMFDQIVLWYTGHQEEKWNALVIKFLEDAKKLNLAPA